MDKRIKDIYKQARKVRLSVDDFVLEEWEREFARLIVLECARADSEANNCDHVDGESYNWTILDHFGIKP